MMLLMKLMTAHAILRGNKYQNQMVQSNISTDTSVAVTYPNTSLFTVGVPVQGVNQYNKNAGKGGWGGQCTCADGQVYQVGDNGDSCATLACEGGIRGACNRHGGDWSGAAVTCAPPTQQNAFIEQAGTGGWGGTCTCPDGQEYQVGDHWAACANLACVNGQSGTCNRHESPAWAGKGVVCVPQELLPPPPPKVPVQGANVYNKNAGKGGWGGQCTCADGQVYQVGDNGDSCATLACEGGVRGSCKRHDGPWSGAAATCAPPLENSYIEEADTGGWGGTCTCPDGQTYEVGDHWAACANLACVNGASGTCNRHESPAWAGKGVVCAPEHLLPPPPANTSMPPMEGPPPAMPPVEMPPLEMPPMEGPPGGPPMEGPPGAPPAQVCAEEKKDDAGRCPCPGGCVVDPLPKALANGIVACPSRCYVEVCDSAYYYDAAPVIEKLMQLEAPRVEQLEAKGLDMTEEEFSEYKELVAADGAKLY